VKYLLTYHSITNQGERAYNEDCCACIEDAGNYCFVVADGLGGHGGGDVASQKLVEVFLSEFESKHPDNETFLKAAFESAQAEILKMQTEKRAKLDMKTTAVCLSVIGGKCMWGHIGDSRLYRFYKNKLKIRTLDHSVPQMLVLSGEIKEKHISSHPDRSRLLRVVGVEWTSTQYELSDEIPISECQALLLCTDGFWENIDTKKMISLLKRSTDAKAWLNAMTEEVTKNGQGKDMDNYTAIGIKV
jgi:serine/threonine protein phosphatase PrpC